MKEGSARSVYDSGLRVEAYHFQGFRRPFPNHFHEYYVIGFVEEGERHFTCKKREYFLKKGAVVLLNPGDNHACTQSGDRALDYRGLNIPREIMLDLAGYAGTADPWFSENVVYSEEASAYLHQLHGLVMKGSRAPGRNTRLCLLLSRLFRQYGRSAGSDGTGDAYEVRRACEFIRRHYGEHISLEQLCRCSGMSKSTLLRAFMKEKGVTPYVYLENIRVSAARRLLEQGTALAEAALRTGFSDQSHFTNCFTRFIGLAPGAYRKIFLRKEDV